MPDQPAPPDLQGQTNQPDQRSQPDQSASSQPNRQDQPTRQDHPKASIASALKGKVPPGGQTGQSGQQAASQRQEQPRLARQPRQQAREQSGRPRHRIHRQTRQEDQQTAGRQPPNQSPSSDNPDFNLPEPPSNEKSFAGMPKPQPEQTVLEWQAPSRPFKQRNRRYYSTVGLIVFLIVLILFFAGQFLPIAVVIAVAFLGYVLSSVPPETIINKLTTYGIRTDNDIYYWEELGRFWFEDKYDSKLLRLEVARFPHRLTLLLGEQTEEIMTAVLSEVLLQEKPKDSYMDKAANWLQEKVPLDG